jgi:hypothetical protein
MKSPWPFGKDDPLSEREADLERQAAELAARAEALERELRGELPPETFDKEPAAIWQAEEHDTPPVPVPAGPVKKLRAQEKREQLILIAWLVGLVLLMLIVYSWVK